METSYEERNSLLLSRYADCINIVCKKMNKKFELKTLEEYSDKALIDELHRVAELFVGRRLTRNKFNKFSRVHSSTLENRFGSWRNALDQAGISVIIAPRITPLKREKLLDALKKYADEFPGSFVTIEEIAKRLGVSRSSISGRFGKWEDLLAAIGLKSKQPRYSDEECYENIILLWTHYGRQPHFAELNEPPSKVGSKAYVGRWGGWRTALSAFIKYVNQESQQSPIQIIENPELNKSPSAPSIPRSISLSLRYKVLCRDRFRCVICGRSPAKDINVELHVDHIKPWSKGGQNTEENLRTLCFDCNLGKGAKKENA